MKSLLTLLCITLTVFITFLSRADTDDILFYDPNFCPPAYDSHFPIGFNWIVQRYDFDRIEEYVDEYTLVYYKYSDYLTSKQKEIAGKFGLSDVFFRPNFRRYENTKVVFSKGIWDNRLILRYLAPVSNIGDFEIFFAVKPQRFVTFILRGQMNGEQSVALVINGPLGGDNTGEDATKQVRRWLDQAKRFVN